MFINMYVLCTKRMFMTLVALEIKFNHIFFESGQRPPLPQKKIFLGDCHTCDSILKKKNGSYNVCIGYLNQFEIAAKLLLFKNNKFNLKSFDSGRDFSDCKMFGWQIGGFTSLLWKVLSCVNHCWRNKFVCRENCGGQQINLSNDGVNPNWKIIRNIFWISEKLLWCYLQENILTKWWSYARILHLILILIFDFI